jgi:hypothetical protein
MTGLLHGGSEHRVYIYRRRRVVNTRYRGIYRGVRTSDPRLVRVHGTGSDGAGDPVGGSAQRQVGEDEVLVVKSQWRVGWRLMAREEARQGGHMHDRPKEEGNEEPGWRSDAWWRCCLYAD